MAGNEGAPRRRTRLVCTLGPASGTPERIRALAIAGTDVFRVNFSHGDLAQHAELVRNVRSLSEAIGADLAVMADLPGPKIRLGELKDQPVRLETGARFVLRASGGVGDATGAVTTYAQLANDVRIGDRILLADGAVELTVERAIDAEVVTEVARGGQVRSGAGVNVPAERLGLPAITERDREGLASALDLGVDLVAQSFVRRGADVVELRSLMGDRAVPIVAKIETRPATMDIDSVLDAADAIMVARGDLGVELPMEEIPILQKELLRAARAASKPGIVATQMLESMMHAPRPTRAEASDVANAVLDGADAIMLSGETAIGEFPEEAARAASRIAVVAERRGGGFHVAPPGCTHRDEAAAVAHAAAQIASDDPAVVAIACYTSTGRTASLLSSERPSVPIVAFSRHASVRRWLRLRWGVDALETESPRNTDEMIAAMDRGIRGAGLAREGDAVVMAASSPVGRTHTNLLKVHHLGASTE